MNNENQQRNPIDETNMIKTDKEIKTMRNCNNTNTNINTDKYWYQDNEYSLNNSGLFKLNKVGEKILENKISDAIRVSKNLINYESKLTGDTPDQALLIEFYPLQEKLDKNLIIFKKDLANSKFIQSLMGLGLYINQCRKKELPEFLMRQPVPECEFYVKKAGWTSDLDAFVLPNATHTWESNKQDKIRLITPCNQFQVKESMPDWVSHVLEPSIDNPLFLFSLAVSCTPPLLKVVGMDSFCVNLFGESSKGKTTAVQVASTVWGSGSLSNKSYIGTWNATGNALTALAAGSNDVLMAVDELGSFQEESLGNVIYTLSGGHSRKAMKANNEFREDITWNTILLSTGELSGRHKIESSYKQMYAGQLNRFLDIPINELQQLDNADKVDKLKESCGSYYGHLGKAFIKGLIKHYKDKESMVKEVKKLQEDHQTRLLSLLKNEIDINKLNTEVKRSMKRFALIYTASELFCMKDIVDITASSLTEEKMLESLDTMFIAWFKELNLNPRSSSDRLRQLAQSYLIKHQSKFIRIKGGKEVNDEDQLNKEKENFPSTVIGYYNVSSKLFLLTEDTFSKCCTGFSNIESSKLLKEMSYLSSNDEKRMKSKHTVPTANGKASIRFYAIKDSILDDED